MNTKTTKMKLTITHNGFHGSTSSSIIVDGNPGDNVELSRSQIKKLDRTACGISECECGESLLVACDATSPFGPAFIAIPEEGTEINVNGKYPQL